MFDWFVSFRVNFVVSIVSMFHLFFKKYFLVVGSVFFGWPCHFQTNIRHKKVEGKSPTHSFARDCSTDICNVDCTCLTRSIVPNEFVIGS